MRRLPTIIKWACVAGLIGFVAGGTWIVRLPEGVVATAAAVPLAESAASLVRLHPPKRPQRPVVAVIGLNAGTETTDYLMPTGILRRADVAEVKLVAVEDNPVKLYPALSVQPDMDIAGFDAEYPAGADYVIVPAMRRDDDPAIAAWLRDQQRRGAILIGVCAGAKVLAAAGLLRNHRATTHWFYRDKLRRIDPSITLVADRRWVVEPGLATTTGISASMPMALTLIEAIAGRGKALEVARSIGVEHWDAGHASAAFRMTRPFATTVLANRLRFWQRDELEIAVAPGFDAVSLAIAADAWSRTYRSRAVARAPAGATLIDRDGIRVLPDAVGPAGKNAEYIDAPGMAAPAATIDRTLAAIAGRYGDKTADVVAMQLEYLPHSP
ncbi:DJ-1/PfpI family protein [Pseudoxanthomonas helianthi]|uniref:DJ-1/PfpI family protein n=1 Tax=Pseudoxanthomonas helianthi TaxID=1453541 RepID=A0A941AUL5_9GAMM|nr:DJ-1/PfpI family protein [Pseudoxanthomonas helianthi]MBP3983313.1 DJ-1/PfpI family protein [Pseudoxanthomonas helianthi]